MTRERTARPAAFGQVVIIIFVVACLIAGLVSLMCQESKGGHMWFDDCARICTPYGVKSCTQRIIECWPMAPEDGGQEKDGKGST